ncbi:MAG: TrkA family potassium uptake protein [Clostridia bacterium]|nr:TrkA family potassium uptake protein [Clostridia bacterium]
MKKSFIIIGLGRFGINVARILASKDADILAVDINESRVSDVTEIIHHCAICDATNYEALKSLGVEKIDHAVIAIGNSLQNSVLTLVNLKKLGMKNITVRADEEDHAEVYRALGANEVIIPEESSAVSLAYQMLSDTVLDYYKVSENYAMVQISVEDGFEPRSLIDLDVRNRFDVNVIGFIKKDDFVLAKGADLIEPGCIIVVVGTRNKVFEFDKFLNSDSEKKTGIKSAGEPKFRLKKR